MPDEESERPSNVAEFPSQTRPEGDGTKTAETRAHEFIDQINRENEGGVPMPEPEPLPFTDPIQFLIDRVDRVVYESVQMGTEPLSTKAAVLASLYQAKALETMAYHLGDISAEMVKLRQLLESLTDGW